MRYFVVMFKHCDFIAFFLRPLKLRTWRQTLSQLLLSKKCIIAWQFRHQFQSFVPLLQTFERWMCNTKSFRLKLARATFNDALSQCLKSLQNVLQKIPNAPKLTKNPNASKMTQNFETVQKMTIWNLFI